MNFSGWIPLRRGVIVHTADGRMSNTEMLVFIYLIALADKETGSGTINAPTLRAFLPGLSYDAAKRVLCSLESKGYIFRDITPFSKQVYRFWVNKYQPTVGKYKLLQTNISKALETRDVNDIEYVDPAPETAPVGAPVTAPVTAPYYKKREERIEKDKTNTVSSECASLCDSSDPINETQVSLVKHTVGSADAQNYEHKSVHHEAQKSAQTFMHQNVHQPVHQVMHQPVHQVMHQPVHQVMHQDTTHVKDTPPSPEEVGLKWSGIEGAYIDISSGRVLSFNESARRLGKEI